MSLYNSNVAVRCHDGVYRSIYVHSGGSDLRHVLLNFWNDQERAELLVSGGNVSSVAKTFADMTFYIRDMNRDPDAEATCEGPTLFHVMSAECVFDALPTMINKDHYLFEGGTWFIFDPHMGDNGVVVPLAEYEAELGKHEEQDEDEDEEVGAE